MKEKSSALYSRYVIDGREQPLTPAALLDDLLLEPRRGNPEKEFERIADETVDPSPSSYQYDDARIDAYLKQTLAGGERRLPLHFAAAFTRSRIAKALIDTLWLRGRFRLGDLALRAEWKWETKTLGNMAAFYASVEAAADYIDSLGLRLGRYSFSEAEECSVAFKAAAISRPEDTRDEDDMDGPVGMVPFGTEHPRMGRLRAYPAQFVPDKDSWLIYIPFDSSPFRLGGSLLAQTVGTVGNTCPEVMDADYLMDCYEVVRELVEDGIILSGATVGDGGLLTSLRRMCPEGWGASVSISGILSAYNESGIVRVLFAEVPGIILQIRDADYDYVDAEFLLQDVAFYPLGHPVSGKQQVLLDAGGGSPLSSILQSLLSGGASEGED